MTLDRGSLVFMVLTLWDKIDGGGLRSIGWMGKEQRYEELF